MRRHELSDVENLGAIVAVEVGEVVELSNHPLVALSHDQ